MRGRAAILRDQAQLVIGSPPCTAFSTLQKIHEVKWRGRPNKERMRQKVWKQAVKRVECCIELYKHQLKHGRRFLHVHPLGATSWGLPVVQSLLQDVRVMQIKADTCRFGMTSAEPSGNKHLIRKPTRFITNSWGIACELDTTNEGGHVHRHLIAGREKGTAVYPDRLCQAICRGLEKEDTENARLSTTRNIYKKELNNIAKKGGAKHKHALVSDGIKQHWRDDVHEEDGAQMTNNGGEDSNYAENLKHSMNRQRRGIHGLG